MSQLPTWEEQVKAAKRKNGAAPTPPAVPDPPANGPTAPQLMRQQAESLVEIAWYAKRISRRLAAIELLLVLWFLGAIVAGLLSLASSSNHSP